MMPQSQAPSSSHTSHTTIAERLAPRKRKAESQDNERLSKRLGRLHIEPHNTPQSLYAPSITYHITPTNPTSRNPIPTSGAHDATESLDEPMQLDDTKHKVYIYNIDDELTDEEESDSCDSSRKLTFLPDIDKHLRSTRIPPSILANSDGELAGMQIVLYSDPKSISVPEDRDGVRKVVIDARKRLREKQQQKKRQDQQQQQKRQDLGVLLVEAHDPEAMEID